MAAHDHFLLAFLIFIISFLTHTQSQKAETSTAISSQTDHCLRSCRGKQIPYPFGVKGCCLNEAFEVRCNETSGSATIASLGWEIDNISFESHTLHRQDFNVQALKVGSGKRQLPNFPNLEHIDDHYWISHTENLFVAKGCEILASLYDNKTRELLGLCATSCRVSSRLEGVAPWLSSTCRGLHCCHIHLLRETRNFSLEIHRLANSRGNHCSFFTFVAMGFPFNKLSFSACDNRYTVPVVYEWAVGNTTCDEGNVCGHNTQCINNNASTGYRCRCREGYHGNPYLRQGCEDTNECENPKLNKCHKDNRCFNTAGSYYCLPNRRHMLAVLIPLGIGLAVGLLILAATGLWIWQKIKKIKYEKTKHRFFKRNGGLILQEQLSSSRASALPELQLSSSRASALPELTLFKIEELEKTTDKFSESRILGKGGIGTVYKGMLSDGRLVAVKKANIANESQVGQFVNEAFVLSQVSHRHIVKLLGCCLETEVPLLVYEYVSNGTLSDHIHDKPSSSTISWENRLRIAAEIAGALAYLHSYASTAIFHRDIKSNNILLDENYKAVVSDFGLARSVSVDRTHLTTLVGGTFGYLDPEYFQSGHLNDKSDVYAFRVVLAEILTGQKPVSSVTDDTGLAFRFRTAVKKHHLFEILDKVVRSEGQEDKILGVAKLAVRCLKVEAHKRPCMKEVAAELDQLRKTRELQGHQESFRDEHRCISIKCYSSGTDSESEDDQENLHDEQALLIHVGTA